MNQNGYDILMCQEPPVKDRWHEFATLRVVLEHLENQKIFDDYQKL